jgi:hypothetical protein
MKTISVYLHAAMISGLLLPVVFTQTSAAKAIRRTDRIAVFADCVTVLGRRLPLDANDFSDREILGESSDDVRFLLGDMDYERRLGHALVRMREIQEDNSVGDEGKKAIRRLWSDRQVVALRLASRDMAEDWADHLRKGFSAREKVLRRQFGEETYQSVSAAMLSEAVSK